MEDQEDRRGDMVVHILGMGASSMITAAAVAFPIIGVGLLVAFGAVILSGAMSNDEAK